MSKEEEQIILGKVGAVYGIKGWLKIHSFTDETEAILDYFPWSLKLGNNTQTVEITFTKNFTLKCLVFDVVPHL